MIIEVLYLPKNFYTPKQSSGYAPGAYCDRCCHLENVYELMYATRSPQPVAAASPRRRYMRSAECSLAGLEVGKKKYRYAAIPPLSPFPSASFPFPSPSLLLPLCPLPLRIWPLKSSQGSAVSSPSGVRGGAPAANALQHILHLGNASGRNNFNDFPDNQLTKFRALQNEQQILQLLGVLRPTGMAVGQKEVAV